MTESTHIVCTSCDGVNRVPAGKNAADAQCGKCHTALFQKHPIPLDTARFDRHIGRSDVPVVVDFWASWCGPCQMMAPELDRASAMLEPEVRLAKVNTEDNPALAARYNIRGIPTLVMFKGGQEMARISGAMGASELVSWIRRSGG